MTDQAMVVAPECVPIEESAPMTAIAVVAQVRLIQEVMRDVMKPVEHYGTIPGCGDKPSLFNPGAQKLAMAFRLAPKLEIERIDLAGGHREYLVTCQLVSITSGQLMGEGVGSCSTMESKYRYRNVSDYTDTGEQIPEDYKARKAEYRKKGLGAKQIDGVWAWVRYGDSAKTENPDIADTYNTVLKMAKKRAFVDAVLTTTAASDIFTQDLEDLPSPSQAFSAPPTAPRTTEATQSAAKAPTDDIEAAKAFAMPFGKHKGVTLRELTRLDEDYLSWLASKCDKPDVAAAAKLVYDGWIAAKETAERREALPEPDMAQRVEEATGGELLAVENLDEDIPF